MVRRTQAGHALRVYYDEDLKGEYSRLVRDIGIFKQKDQSKWIGFASFAQIGTSRVFCQSPGSHFIVYDQDYLRDVRQQFAVLWNDASMHGHDGSRKKTVSNWLSDVPATAYEWAASESALSASALEALSVNRIPAIRIQNFATPDECRRLVLELESAKRERYTMGPSDPPVDIVGTPVYECRNKPKAEYFQKAKEARDLYDAICKKSGWDPVARMRKNLLERCGIDAAFAIEPDHGSYFAGLVRFIEKGALCHVDFAPADAVGYSIDKVVSQVAWNVILAAPDHGGYCTVYDSAWRPGFERFREAQSYGYDTTTVVAGAKRFSIRSVCGDAVMFNCGNFHEVCSSEGDRITVGSFLGKLPTHKYVLWS